MIFSFIFILIDKLGFQSFRKTLRYSIVIAISFSAHTTDNVFLTIDVDSVHVYCIPLFKWKIKFSQSCRGRCSRSIFNAAILTY